MTPGVPYPPNPPENPYRRPVGQGFSATERRDNLVRGWDEGFSAAGSWWRSRLVSDETVEAVAKVIAGPAKCCCDDDWRLPPSRVCPVHGEGSWPYQSHYAKARAVLAALLPVAEKPPEEPAICNRCGAPKGMHAVGESCNQNCGGRVVPVAEKPETPDA